MSIYDLRVNGEKNVWALRKDNLYFSFKTDLNEDEYVIKIQQDDKDVYQEVVGIETIHSFTLKYDFVKGETYKVVVSTSSETSEPLNFRIASDIVIPLVKTKDDFNSPCFRKQFSINKVIKHAYLNVTGLGIYVSKINDVKVGELYLTPGFNDYDNNLRYQVYDIKDLLKENNTIQISLGNGWYKGRIGYEGKGKEIWGNDFIAGFALEIEYTDGTKEVIDSSKDVKAYKTTLVDSSIYDGEVHDYRISSNEAYEVVPCLKTFALVPQDGCFTKEINTFDYELYISPKNETILDFKQNIAGVISFKFKENKGDIIHIQFGELLQDECFYNENLRTAKSEIVITCDGNEHEFNEYFTYHGFRYVKVTGISDIKKAHFVAHAISSNIDNHFVFETNNKYINKLVENTKWSQNDNFVDIPTDCPQRDERLGWTADIQVFSRTSCYHGNCYSFFNKYLEDIRAEQKLYYKGDVPAYAPSLKGVANKGGAVWSDVTTILPMNIYRYYGNKENLAKHIDIMKNYVDVLVAHDKETGYKHLIKDGFTFGDWLAMDGLTPQSMKGGTEDNYIQTMYYYHSLELLVEALEITNQKEDISKYKLLKEEVKEAILNEYFSNNGRLCLDTQTSFVLALAFDVYRNKDVIIKYFKNRLTKDSFQLKTGFTGTSLLLPVLFNNGMEEEAFRILFSETCPGWIYPIKLGATTIWERWNSVLEDGKISGTDMNSMNHYANGSVLESVYEYIVGLKPLKPAFKEVSIKPILNYRINELNYSYESMSGRYSISYTIKENVLDITIKVPYGCKAHVTLPEKEEEVVDGGTYHYSYRLAKDYMHPFSIHTKLLDLKSNPETLQILQRHGLLFGLSFQPDFATMSANELTYLHFLPVQKDDVIQLDKELKEITSR